MKLKTRRILYIFTILFFLALTPVILSYGFGLRYDTNSKTFIKTGGIYINAYPKNVTVTLDDSSYASKTPIRLRYLLPKTYSLTINKEGFSTLSTTADIHQNEVILFDPIELIPQQPSNQTTLNAQYAFSSPYDSQTLLFTKVNEEKYTASVLLNSKLSDVSGFITDKPENVAWNSVTGDAIIFGLTSKWIYTSTTLTLTQLPQNFSHPVLSAKESGIVYGQLDGHTMIFDSLTEHTTQSPVDGILVYKHNGSYAIVQSSESKQTLIIQNGNSQTTLQTLSDVQTIETLSSQFALVQDLRAYYLLDTAKKQTTFLDSSVISLALTQNTLYYSNALEVWAVNLKTAEKKLINRFGGRISSIALSPHESGLFIRLDGKTLFWYLTTPKTVSVELENVDGVQKINSSSYQTFANEDDTIILRQYSL
ncbi:MAG: PEGA domain-containing protein [Patescibacteria group bacterium]|jgi:hypothetical protein